jgi:predicted LPLAT superfamily acyltransferase
VTAAASSWSGRFKVNGVFWRQFLRWAVLNVPLWLEPMIMAWWSGFFLLWGPGRRGVMHNLRAILPGSTAIGNFARTYRVFWNFAWTIADKMRFQELRVSPDWEFEGIENFRELESSKGGAIILTAHMGNYDLGAHLFATISDRRIVMVRAPETDARTRQWVEQHDGRTTSEGLKVDFNTGAGELALELLEALQRGDIIAIQGDRVTPGISVLPAKLFGYSMEVPAGPFALAMAAGVPIYPLFIFRRGHRRYRLLVAKPFHVIRTRNRAESFERAVSRWTVELEHAVRSAWFQWFTFVPYSKELE